MPRLLLLRHAKADRARSGGKDHDRPLAERGRDESAEIGRIMAERGEEPDLVLCSPSARTRETWEIVRPSLAETPTPRFLAGLYESEGDYIRLLRREGGKAAALLVVGHNPAMHVTAIRLAADLASRDGKILAEHFPPAALAIFEFDGTWKEIAPGAMRLSAFIRPEAGSGGL